MKKRVVVGLSGGVDSSIAAYLLKQQGYDVIGIFMRNWHNDAVTLAKECPWWEDSADALVVAQQLSIPFQIIDFSQAYKKSIVDYMFAEYQRGRTPNPDILCNREIKFNLFLDTTLKLGADFMATGHYCRKEIVSEKNTLSYRLLSGKDVHKDQSYFLCQLTQSQLAKALFPLGEITKTEVRAIAKRLNLCTAEKKDSQGLCFVGKVNLPEFLQQKLKPKKGKIVAIPPEALAFHTMHSTDMVSITQPYNLSLEMGHVVGEHNGAHYYTIGQRKGLHTGGQAEPLFVIGLDTKENIVYVGQGNNHPGLYRKGLFVACGDDHWIRSDLQPPCGESKAYDVRIRYRQPLVSCLLTQQESGTYIEFEQPQRGVAPGQFVAWYQGEELIGSGVIN